jgi:hypothetical protein
LEPRGDGPVSHKIGERSMPLGPGTKLGPYEILALLGVLLETCLADKLAFGDGTKPDSRACAGGVAAYGSRGVWRQYFDTTVAITTVLTCAEFCIINTLT